MVVKQTGLEAAARTGLPLELVVTDPRGVEIRSQMIKFSPPDSRTTRPPRSRILPPARTISRSTSCAMKISKALLGSTTVRVEEFQPDRMTIKARTFRRRLCRMDFARCAERHRDAAHAVWDRRGGPPASKARFKLTPSGAEFDKYPDYRFVDPYNTKKSYDEDLGEISHGRRWQRQVRLQARAFREGSVPLALHRGGLRARRADARW